MISGEVRKQFDEVLARHPQALWLLILRRISAHEKQTWSRMLHGKHNGKIIEIAGRIDRHSFAYGLSNPSFMDYSSGDLIKTAFELGHIDQAMDVNALLEEARRDPR